MPLPELATQLRAIGVSLYILEGVGKLLPPQIMQDLRAQKII